MIKQTIAGLSFLFCISSAQADVVSTFIVPKVAGAAVEALAKVFDTIVTLSTADQKEWNRYMIEQQNLIRQD